MTFTLLRTLATEHPSIEAAFKVVINCCANALSSRRIAGILRTSVYRDFSTAVQKALLILLRIWKFLYRFSVTIPIWKSLYIMASIDIPFILLKEVKLVRQSLAFPASTLVMTSLGKSISLAKAWHIFSCHARSKRWRYFGSTINVQPHAMP